MDAKGSVNIRNILKKPPGRRRPYFRISFEALLKRSRENRPNFCKAHIELLIFSQGAFWEDESGFVYLASLQVSSLTLGA